jgi:hypothetical protein
MYWSPLVYKSPSATSFKGNTEGARGRERRVKQLLNIIKEIDAGFLKRKHWIALCVELPLKRLQTCRKTNYVPSFTL